MNSKILNWQKLPRVVRYSLLMFFLIAVQTLVSAQHQEYIEASPDEIVTLDVVLPFQEQAQEVSVYVYDGIAYIDGDIMIGNIRDLRDLQQRGVGINLASYKWPNSAIPYTIGSGFSSSQTTDIINAINHINLNTNLCVIPRTTESNYVEFTTSTGCSSYVGMIGGMQEINLAPGCSYGSIIHEILHASGIYHEQSRSDRDNYVNILTSNIQTGYEGNFDIANTSYTDDFGAYDYNSIMHYGNTYFGCWSCNGIKQCDPDYCSNNSCSGCTKLQTITTIPSGISIGQRSGLSSGDINTVNAMYPTACSTGCEASKNITSTITGNYSIEVSNYITASNIITSSGNADYQAGNRITLQTGFRAYTNSSFRAHIDPCSSSFSSGEEIVEQNINGEEIIDHTLLAVDDTMLDYKLSPNPFSNATTLEYHLSRNSKVEIGIYNHIGQLVKQPLKETAIMEGHNKLEINTADLAEGIYFCKIQIDGQLKTMKMVLSR